MKYEKEATTENDRRTWKKSQANKLAPPQCKGKKRKAKGDGSQLGMLSTRDGSHS